MKRVTKQQREKLTSSLWQYYDDHGRHDISWRTRPTPYRVVVSEIMLQQTQVARVEEYFTKWMKKYPSWRALARALLRDILLDWQGLGYNRRGKYLHDIAQIVTDQYHGTLPSDRSALESLPGIGHYTAGSIRAFVFNEMDVFLETNIRIVLIHHCYSRNKNIIRSAISDQELLSVLNQIVTHDMRAQQSPRDFYYAMMDYGSYLKQTVGNLNARSGSYIRQSRFDGSRRQLRAGILRYVLRYGPVDESNIITNSQRDGDLVRKLLGDLVREGSIKQKKTKYFV